MTQITTRAGKGSPLTIAEMDANFTNLNADKIEPGLSGFIDQEVLPPYPLSKLPQVKVSVGTPGSGTVDDPFIIGGGFDPTAIPGYSLTDTKALFIQNGALVWATQTSGGALDPTTLSIDNVGPDALRLKWTAVLDAVTILIQRDISSSFANPVTVYSGVIDPLLYTNTGLSASTHYYYRARVSAPGFQSSTFSLADATTTSGGNTTPAPPTVTFNTDTRVLTASHALGTSEIVMSIAGASFVPYAVVNVDANPYEAANWRYKIKAATGRNESDIANSPAIAAGGSGGNIGNMLTPGDVQYKDDNITVNGSGDLVKTVAANGGFLVPTFSIALGASGFIATQRKALSSGGLRSAVTTLMIGVDPPYGAGDPKCLMAFYWEPSGIVFYKIKNAGAYTQSAAGTLLLNGFVRARATNSTVYLEVSNNAGVSWTEIVNTPRMSADTTPVDGILRNKTSFEASTDMQDLFNFRLYNGS